MHLSNEKRPDHVSEIISVEDYDKARNYKLDKHRFGFVEAIFGRVQTTVSFIVEFFLSEW